MVESIVRSELRVCDDAEFVTLLIENEYVSQTFVVIEGSTYTEAEAVYVS